MSLFSRPLPPHPISWPPRWQKCPVCEGRGWTFEGSYYTGFPNKWFRVTCKSCEGKGIVR